ncbi:universal stress protein [Thiosocius teredinicola]|uniref:universal stress protein n=1 Tax=Thiosocius teredinicola TaxID=1973002 RepID=UPI000F7790A0
MHRFKNIVFFAAGETQPSPALRRAVALAESNDARLTIIDVLPSIETPAQVREHLDVELDEVLRDRRQAALDQLAEPFRRDDTLLYTEVLTGNPFVEAIRAVIRRDYDLLIKTAQGDLDVGDHLFGSIDMHLLRKCPCPVWIDHPQAASPYRHVLAAVDPRAQACDGCAKQVMDLAHSLAVRESAELAIVHAWRLDGESILRNGRFRLPQVELDNLLETTQQQHDDALTGLLQHYQLASGDPCIHLVKGAAAPAILDVATQIDADVIVMGTVGRTGIPGLFIGNTAEEVLQKTHASVLAVKPAGFVSPVE